MSGDFTDVTVVVMWFPTVTLALWLKCTYQRLHIVFLSMHLQALLSDICLSIFTRHFLTDSSGKCLLRVL